LAGIYIHIPFCKQACSYCNFHFSTSLRRKNELVAALLSETDLRKDYLNNESIETIYFGGGTPSLLPSEDHSDLIKKIYSAFKVSPDAEITLETNPDDISEDKLKNWKDIGINRLSIGVQSFFEEDLVWMNRAHNQQQAYKCIEDSLAAGFDNISIDLIYGIPSPNHSIWKNDLEKALALNIQHISSYCLTIEPSTGGNDDAIPLPGLELVPELRTPRGISRKKLPK